MVLELTTFQLLVFPLRWVRQVLLETVFLLQVSLAVYYGCYFS